MLTPAATSTLPEGSRVAVWPVTRGKLRLPVRTQAAVPEQAVPPVTLKVVEVERPWAFVTVAVREGVLSECTQEGGVQLISLWVAALAAVPSVPLEAVHEKERALP